MHYTVLRAAGIVDGEESFNGIWNATAETCVSDGTAPYQYETDVRVRVRVRVKVRLRLRLRLRLRITPPPAGRPRG